MAAPDLSNPSVGLSEATKSHISNSNSNSNSQSTVRVQDASATAAYEQYLRMAELSKLWCSKEFPQWNNESLIKPMLQAFEITFRFISVALSDPRPYANHRESRRRLESLAMRQVEIIAAICEEEASGGGAPIAELSMSEGMLSRERSSQEVWKLPGTSTVVCRTSEDSLLPRLAAWDKSEDVATKILYQIECQLQRCPFTFGLGEPNLAGKPVLEYDLVVRPLELHSLKKTSLESKAHKNHENETLFTVHQILESWLHAAKQLLSRIADRIDGKQWEKAASDCWMLERIWKLLSEMEDLHLLMDPDDFLRLKSQLAIRPSSSSDAFCFRSTALLQVTAMSKDLKHKLPWVVEVEVDPNGGPRVQEATMALLHGRRRGQGDNSGKIDLLQGFQAVEAAVKKFFFGYRQLIMVVMGSLEAGGNKALFMPSDSMDPLAHMFLEPPYYPSLDAAKTFLGDFWHNHLTAPAGSKMI
ncbi:hypothetical protein LUZ60_010827 [Juncus effusus]|nr:hypothetical protein LUZ60_010827 [Juncus effusus]